MYKIVTDAMLANEVNYTKESRKGWRTFYIHGQMYHHNDKKLGEMLLKGQAVEFTKDFREVLAYIHPNGKEAYLDIPELSRAMKGENFTIYEVGKAKQHFIWNKSCEESYHREASAEFTLIRRQHVWIDTGASYSLEPTEEEIIKADQELVEFNRQLQNKALVSSDEWTPEELEKWEKFKQSKIAPQPETKTTLSFLDYQDPKDAPPLPKVED